LLVKSSRYFSSPGSPGIREPPSSPSLQYVSREAICVRFRASNILVTPFNHQNRDWTQLLASQDVSSERTLFSQLRTILVLRQTIRNYQATGPSANHHIVVLSFCCRYHFGARSQGHDRRAVGDCCQRQAGKDVCRERCHFAEEGGDSGGEVGDRGGEVKHKRKSAGYSFALSTNNEFDPSTCRLACV